MLLLIPALVQAQFIFTTNVDNTITITSYTGSNGVVMIPGTVAGLPVTSIGDWAFYATSVTNILIPDSVTKIGDGALFYCESLTNVTLGCNVTSIGDWAFGFCPGLMSISCRGNVPSLGGQNVFYGNLATVYYLPGTTNWGPTFDNHPAVLWNPPMPFTYTTNNDTLIVAGYFGSDMAVTIPSTINFLPVISIGESAFNFNSALTSINIPDGVTCIGNSAFLYCDSLTSVKIPNSVTNIGSSAFQWCKNLPAVTIPNGVASFADSVFYDCISLANITFPTNISSIGEEAFWGCGNLTNFAIPNTVTNIGEGAFSGTGLTSVSIPNGITGIAYMTFSGCTLTNVTIPNSVTDISSEAFSYCANLTSVIIPDGVTTIESGVFYDCPNLTSVTIGNGVTSISQGAFWITGLTNIDIPNNVTSIDAETFASTSLTNVTIGNSLTNIGDAFYTCPFFSCPNLMAITVDANNPAYSSVDGVLYDKGQDTLIEYPRGRAGACKVASRVTSIGNYAFYYCTNVIGIYFNGDAPSFGAFVFAVDDSATIYYLPGTTGWSSTYDGLSTALWFLPNPLILSNGSDFGVQNNQFGFTITGPSGLFIVVEACANLASPVWSPVATNNLIGGSYRFSDFAWSNYPSRFYRLSPP